jgi:hypothetical protein
MKNKENADVKHFVYITVGVAALGSGRYCCKKSFRIPTRNIDSRNRPVAQQ